LPIVICESFAATASYNQDEKLVSGEVQGYILHDGDAVKIGKVLIYNTLPQFNKKIGMQNGKVYYITSVAGPKDGTGKVDLQSPCTQFGKLNVAITFVEEPTASMSGISEICKDETAAINFTFTGTPFFDIVYNDGQKDISILNINTLQHPVMFAAPASTTFKLISVKTSGAPGCKGQVITGKNEVAVNVLPALTTQNLKVDCSTDKKNFQISFDINGGKSDTYTVNSSPIIGSLFVSTSLKDGETYNFKIESGANCKPIFVSGTGFCSCPPNALLEVKTISPIKCNGDKNAVLEANVKNIKAPLTYIWSNGATSSVIKNLDANMYKVTISNEENCTLIDSVVLKNPSPIRTFVEVQDARCFGEANGNITFNMLDGGTPPYLYSIDNALFTKDSIFSKLKSNRYDLVVKDANNCVWENVIDLKQPEEFYVRLGEDQIINLGQATQIQAIVSADYETIKWSDNKIEGTNISITPLKSIEYKITATDKNGCEAKDAIWIYVKSERDVFAPRNFSPNNDGYNDAFTIFAGVDVSKIKQLQVFDRWGSEVFNATDINPNDEGQGWQGTFRGQIASQDLYIYKATVEFIDGKSKKFSGEVSLLR
jgi:gliding motility-associated-like protein